MFEDNFDYIVVINGVVNSAELIKLEWCSYDYRTDKVVNEEKTLIKPANRAIDPRLLEDHEIKLEDIQNAPDLKEALNKFNEFVFQNYFIKGKSFTIVAFSDWLINIQLAREAKSKGIALATSFNKNKTYNILSLFQKRYADAIVDVDPASLNLEFIKSFFNMNSNSKKMKNDLVLHTKILKKMVKAEKEERGEEIDAGDEQNNGEINNNEDEEMGMEGGKLNSAILSNNPTIPTKKEKSKEAVRSTLSWNNDYSQSRYIKIRNLPYNINTKDLILLFDQFHVVKENIAHCYDILGRKHGEAIIEFESKADFFEVLTCFKFNQFNNHLLEIVESNKSEFTRALTCKVLKRQQDQFSQGLEKCFMKVKNLPPLTSESNILSLFNKYTIAMNGIKFLRLNNGSVADECIVAFVSEEDLTKALKEKNDVVYNNTRLKLELSNLSEYEDFASSNANHYMLKRIAEWITPDKVCKSLFARNFPLDYTIDNVLKFFHIFNLNDSNIIYDKRLLHDFGAVIITFFSEEDANLAKQYLSKQVKEWNNRNKKIRLDNLLSLINRANEY